MQRGLRFLVNFVGFLLIAVAIAGCNFKQERVPAPQSGDGQPGGDAYPRLAAELFNPTCASCHNHGRSAGGVNVTTYEELRAMPGLIVPGRKDSSRVYIAIESGAMPMGGGSVSPELLTALGCWIDAGAEKTGAGECFPGDAGLDGGGSADQGGTDQGGTDQDGTDADPGSPGPGTSDFRRLMTGLFGPSCAGCHNTGRADGGVNLTTHAAIMGAGIVNVGDSSASTLYTIIKSGDMPRGGGPVAPTMLVALACWIDRGALADAQTGCFGATPPPPPPPGGGDDNRGDDDHGDDD